MNIAKWLIGFGFLFLVGTILANIMEGAYFDSNDLYFVQAMNDFKIATSSIANFVNPMNMLSGISHMIQAIGQWVTWDYSFFYGTWEVFRYFLWTISFGFLFSLGLQVAQALKWI